MRNDYEWYVDLGPAAVVWRQQGDEWLHRLRVALEEGEDVKVTGHRFDESTKPYVAVRLAADAGELPCQLLVAAGQEEIRVVVAGDGPVDEVEIEALYRGVRRASSQLGESGEPFEWSAILGYQRERIGGIEKRLAVQATVGGLTVTSSDRLFTEADPSHSATLSGWMVHRSVPMIVRGKNRGYSWEAARVHAAAALHRLSALVSLAWGGPIVVRGAPAPLEWGVREVPDRPPWDESDSLDDDEESDPSHVAPATLPDWLDAAWTRLAEEPKLADSLAAFHEGARLANAHPSLSLVSFIASIEAIGTLLFKPQRCSQCGSHRDVTKRFRATAQRVVDVEEAAVLGSAYGPRSRTVHAGQLHGGEHTPGITRLRVWSEDPVREFRWGVLHRMERASRRLLEDALMNGLPPRVAFDP